MRPIAGLADALSRLSQEKKLVLLTNSPQSDSEAILGKLGLADVFDHKIFMGMKPVRSLEHFRELAVRYDCSFAEIISVGDNWVNDIYPPRELGCKTIFIDHHGQGEADSADVVVRSMKEVVDIFNKL
jgi:FMN phosphatase YigB (HAD superfamily)